MKRKVKSPFRTVKEEVMQLPKDAGLLKELAKRPNSSQLAFFDQNFILKDELRPVRLQMELLKPELALEEQKIKSTIVVFGSARILDPAVAEKNLVNAKKIYHDDPSPENQGYVKKCEKLFSQSHYYQVAQDFGGIVSAACKEGDTCDYVITTGGGPGIMEAACRGSFENGSKTVGFNIFIPHEQMPNKYITPELSFHFHYFSMRKMHFLMRARALVAFPGGYGTLDELFEVLTLLQTRKILPIPVLLFGKHFWEKLINFEYLAEEGLIDYQDLKLFHFVESPQEAWQIILSFYNEQKH